MLNLLIHLRLMNLLLHQYHNVCARVGFYADHEAFGAMYEEVEGEYDSVAERLIGLGDSSQLNLHAITDAVSQKCKQFPIDAKENAALFQAALQLEKELQQQIEMMVKAGGVSQGVVQLLGDIAQRSEIRTYKIKQRIKK